MNVQENESAGTSGSRAAPQILDVLAGRAVQRLRERKGLSRAALGSACGVSGAQIEKYESGVNRISLSRFHTLATALGTTPDALMSELVDALPKPARATASPDARVKAAELARLALRMEQATLDHLIGLAKALAR